jgi:hypothetical protein
MGKKSFISWHDCGDGNNKTIMRYQKQVKDNMGKCIVERFSLVHKTDVFHNHVYVLNTSPPMFDQIARFK